MKQFKILLFLGLTLTFGSCDSNRKHIVKEYYEDGHLKSEVAYSGRNPDGPGKEYFPDGKVKATFNFKNGKPHGKYTSYYENGQIEYAQDYKDGKLHGLWIGFFKNGKKRDEASYNNGNVLRGVVFKSNGDTLSFREGNKVVAYHKQNQIAVIKCVEGNSNKIGLINLDENNKIIRFEGTLPCLSKRDTILLDAQNPKWRKL